MGINKTNKNLGAEGKARRFDQNAAYLLMSELESPEIPTCNNE
jgi:hypothetical protein